jgi:hypothetical protein
MTVPGGNCMIRGCADGAGCGWFRIVLPMPTPAPTAAAVARIAEISVAM